MIEYVVVLTTVVSRVVSMVDSVDQKINLGRIVIEYVQKHKKM